MHAVRLAMVRKSTNEKKHTVNQEKLKAMFREQIRLLEFWVFELEMITFLSVSYICLFEIHLVINCHFTHFV